MASWHSGRPSSHSSVSSSVRILPFKARVPDKLTAIPTPDVFISGLQGGQGDALLLLHGFPQNCLAWHDIMQKLVPRFRVIAMDLRGYGDSSKPSHYLSHEGEPTGEERVREHVLYNECTMAKDCINLMEEFNIKRFYLCGHDRGVRVAHSVCALFPAAVRRAVFLDVSPMMQMYRETDKEFAQRYFHWFFLTQPYPLPEKCVVSQPLEFLKNVMPNCYQLDKRLFLSYLSQLSDYRTVHAMCEEFRATASIDFAQAWDDLKQNVKVMCPLLVLWARYGVLHNAFRPNKPIEDWKHVHETKEVTGWELDCGHFMLDEKPDEIAQAMLNFFVDDEGNISQSDTYFEI